MRSDAKTVDGYLNELPDDRRKAISKVRKAILKKLPKGYVEVMNWGMITYEIPLRTYPETYNKKPLMYAALASQKNYMAVYLMGIYIDDKVRAKFEKDYKNTGKRLDVGSSCVRFRNLEDLPIDLIGDAIALYTPAEFIKRFESETKKRKEARKKAKK